VGCRSKSEQKPKTTTVTKPGTVTESGAAAKIELVYGKGVDADKKVITIGALNDESGPAAAIGKPYAIGKRVLVDLVNGRGTGYIPEGWTLTLEERDHGYNPQKSVQAYKEIKDKVLFIATSFGTPPTLPLRTHLKADNVVAFPASLSSQMAGHVYTPPLGPTYKIEAMRAMDWAVKTAGDAGKVKAAIIYQQDDYGTDGLAGWKVAAAHHKVTIVSEQTVAPGQKDFAAVVMALKGAGANVVLMTVLPSATARILGTAAKLQFGPKWIGQTPSWVDFYFNAEKVTAALFANFYWVQSMPYWGEDLPGMDKFLAAWKSYKSKYDDAKQDFYVLASYLQGLTQLEAVKRAIERGDITRAGYLKALRSLEHWTAGGMIQPVNLSSTPYVTGTSTRVLKPVMDKGTWQEVGGYAVPQSLKK
jgi:ABC-type branched-subunit amino acid transport system substrate-binding protein